MWKGVVNETGKVGLFHPSFTAQQHQGGGGRIKPGQAGSGGGGANNKVIYEGIEKFVKVSVAKGPSVVPRVPPPHPGSNPDTPTDSSSNVNSPTGVLDSSRTGNVDISESAPLISSSSSRYNSSLLHSCGYLTD